MLEGLHMHAVRPTHQRLCMRAGFSSSRPHARRTFIRMTASAFNAGPVVVEKPRGDHTATCILLHGSERGPAYQWRQRPNNRCSLGRLGSSGANISSLAPSVQLDHVKFVCPTAPTRPVSVNMGMTMPAWFDITGFDPKMQDKAGTQAAVEYVSSLIQQEVAAGMPLDRIVVAGFSQGGHVSLKTALAQPQPIAACVGLSTWCEQTAPASDATRQLPVFVGHGSADPLVPASLATRTVDGLKASGMRNVEFHMYPALAHTTSPQELADLRTFLLKAIPPKKPSLDEVQNWSVKQLRGFLQQRGVNTSTYLEKSEFLDRAKALLK